MSRTAWLWLAAGCALAYCAPVVAAPPDVKFFYPAGVQRGQSVEVSTGGKLDKGVKFWVDRPGLTIELAEKNRLKISAADDASGLYWIRLTNDDGAASLRPFEVGQIAELQEKEPNDKPQSPQVLPAGPQMVNGRFQKNGDVDTYAVQAKQGQTIVATIAGHRPFGSPMDAVLQITDPRGFVVAQNDDDRGFDPLVVFEVPADGTYLVRGFAFPSEPNSSIRFSGAETFVYRMTITTGAYLDHTLPLAAAKDSSPQVQLFGWNLPEAVRSLTVAPGAPGETLRVAHEQLANEMRIPVESHASVLEAEPNNQSDQAQSLAWPVTVSGRIAQAGEEDRFRIKAKKGQSLLFEVETRTLGYPLDPHLTILDKNGKSIAQADDTKTTADPRHTQKFAADGDYTLVVRDRFRHGGLRYVYRLRITEARPDYQLTLKADHFALAAGKTLEIPVTVARLNGFSGEIEVKATDLPAGVTAKTVTSKSKGDTSKAVKLVLKAGDAPVSGQFRITGTAKQGDAQLHRTADGAIESLGTDTSHIWLTVTKSKK